MPSRRSYRCLVSQQCEVPTSAETTSPNANLAGLCLSHGCITVVLPRTGAPRCALRSPAPWHDLPAPLNCVQFCSSGPRGPPSPCTVSPAWGPLPCALSQVQEHASPCAAEPVNHERSARDQAISALPAAQSMAPAAPSPQPAPRPCCRPAATPSQAALYRGPERRCYPPATALALFVATRSTCKGPHAASARAAFPSAPQTARPSERGCDTSRTAEAGLPGLHLPRSAPWHNTGLWRLLSAPGTSLSSKLPIWRLPRSPCLDLLTASPCHSLPHQRCPWPSPQASPAQPCRFLFHLGSCLPPRRSRVL